MGDPHAMLLRNCESSKNRYSKGHALILVVN